MISVNSSAALKWIFIPLSLLFVEQRNKKETMKVFKKEQTLLGVVTDWWIHLSQTDFIHT